MLRRGALYHLLGNPLYIGKTAHKGKHCDGMHEAIIDQGNPGPQPRVAARECGEASGPARAEIEARVIDSVGSFLEDSVNIADHFSGLPIPGVRMLTSAASHRATLLRKGAEQEKAQLISRIVSSVVVQSDTLQIENSKGARATFCERR